MTPNDEDIRLAIADRASEWFVENRSGPLNRETSAHFIAWLKASPVHVGEYLAIAGLVRDLDAATRRTDIALEPLLARARAQTDHVVKLDLPVRKQTPVAMRSRVWRPWLRAAAAGLAFMALAAVWMTRDGERFGLPRTYTTAHGEQVEEQLPDGSVLHLNTDSQVTVRYSRRERVVDLDRGEALFQVARSGERGFRVAAGNAQVLDVGTEFDVYRRSDSVRVTVVEGTVAVYTGSPHITPAALRLVAGYQVEIRGTVGLPSAVNARAAVGWLRRQIAFENEPLGAVAEEFNRYGQIPIEIDDEALRKLPITGVFDPYDTESFVVFLAVLNDVVVERTATRVRILSRASALPEQRSDAR
jgi:transmembrane sensor